MICGLNEKAELNLKRFSDNPCSETRQELYSTLSLSIAAGDNWYVPLDAMHEGTNELDYGDGWLLGDTGMVKKTVTVSETQEQFFCFFLTEESLRVKQNKDIVSMHYPARELLEETIAADNVEGIILNPWTESITIKKGAIPHLLDEAKNVDTETVMRACKVMIEPISVIDTNAILNQWTDGWEDETVETWSLHSYPIMSNGHILVVFEMAAEIKQGKISSLYTDRKSTRLNSSH